MFLRNVGTDMEPDLEPSDITMQKTPIDSMYILEPRLVVVMG
jgi:hypothetical protein